MAALQLFTLGESGGMLPREILVILGVLRHILVHSKRASLEEAHQGMSEIPDMNVPNVLKSLVK